LIRDRFYEEAKEYVKNIEESDYVLCVEELGIFLLDFMKRYLFVAIPFLLIQIVVCL
jgi:hypothetical protein